MIDLTSLISLLQLEKKDTHHFVGQNYKTAWGRVFGGQVLGQSLMLHIKLFQMIE
jgi:acyl-CoA thioesterase